MTTVEFVVYCEGDHPPTQGDKQRGTTRTGRHYIREDNANELRKWRKAVTAAAPLRATLDGPLVASMVFTIARPKTVTRLYPTGPPDADKMLRALCDALGPRYANVITDDARIIRWEHFAKIYVGTPIDVPAAAALTRPGAWIRLRAIHPDQLPLPG